MADYKFNRAWAEVNLDNLAHNVNEIRRITNKNSEICGVVKADAYGHGVMESVKVLLNNGVERLAVSTLDEAIQLRQNGISVPILILSYTDPRRAFEIITNNLTQTVFSKDLVNELSNVAIKLDKNVKIHIKIDTGMTRVGFMPGYSAIKIVQSISKLPRIIIEGLFTHFSSADEKDKSFTYLQFERFMNICNELDRVGIYIPIKHVCNSAALIEFPEMHLNMVRPGISLYGLYPSKDINKSKINLIPAMTLKANVIFVKDVEKDSYISYGRIFKTAKSSKIATIPIGYADGYTRLLTNKGKVIINGELTPIVGRICMDQCMVDISNHSRNVKVGDEVVLFGKQKGTEITIEDVAKSIGTVNYEVICIIGRRIPRVYLQNEKIYCVLNYLV